MIFPLLLILVLTAFALLAWKNLKLALVLLAGLTPTYLVRFDVGPIPTTLLEGFFLIAFVVFLVQQQSIILDHLQKKFSLTLLSGSLLLLGVASIVAVMIAPDHLSALGIWKAYYVEPFLYALMLLTIFTRKDFIRALGAVFVSGVVLSLFALIQTIFHVGIPDAWAIEGRITSLFPYPNAVGLFLAPLVSAGIVILAHWFAKQKFSQKTRAQTLTLLGAVGLFLVTIALAQTEAALVAIPAALLCTLILIPVYSTKTKRRIFLTATALFLVLITLVPSALSKVLLLDDSGLVRRAQWSETLTMLANNAYLGVGLNGYPAALAPYHNASQYEIFQYPHNIVLNIWSELGVLGLVGFAGILLFSLHFAIHNKKDPLVLACFAALLTMVIHGLVDVPFFKNDLALITALIFVTMIAAPKFTKEA